MPAIVYAADGSVRAIYEDALRPALHALGSVTIRRASHVEPTADARWSADLSPVGGPQLGPYDTRQQALDAEVAWLHANGF